jgi:dihydrofolate synthase/folylpolyglutamate synthase
MDYGEAIDGLEQRVSAPADFGFDAFQNVVATYDNPQHAYDVVHVAGTNGKGSCCLMLAQMLRTAGYTVGLFTGPHLDSHRERIVVDGDPIPADTFATLFEQVQETDCSMFECVTLIAFLYFARQNVDIAVVETGLGGRRDATNVVDPRVAVITNVSREHTDVLGDTVEEIAREKSGIIKPDTAVVTAADEPARSVIQDEAAQVDVPVSVPDAYVSCLSTSPLRLSFNQASFTPAIRGQYQIANINTCIDVVQHLNYAVTDAAIRKALQTVLLPGRMEYVDSDPALILDGAHNRSGIEALASSIDAVDTIVFGCMAHKPFEHMIDTLSDITDNVVFTRPDHPEAADPETLAAEQDGTVITDPVDAVRTAQQQSDDTVLVTGSMYLLRSIRLHLLQSQGYSSNRITRRYMRQYRHCQSGDRQLSVCRRP